MVIREAKTEDQAAWDDYVTKHPHSTPYHLFGWGIAIKKAYNHPMHYLIAEEGEHICGVFPCIYIKPPIIRGELSSLPFCDVGGVLSDSVDIGRKLISEAISLGKMLGVRCIEVRQTDQELDIEGALPTVLQSGKVRMVLDLPASSDELMKGFKSKLRSQLRKSENNGLEFRWSEAGRVDAFYSVFSENMRSLGSPVHSMDWFISVLAYLGERAKIGTIYHGDMPIGAGVVLCHAGSVTIPWASTLKNYNHLSPNMLLYWNFLKYASDSGFSQFDFGRSTPGEGTYKFKEQWGAKPLALFWHYITVCGKKEGTLDSSSNSRKIVENLWKRLPLSVANTVGPAIRKYISL